VPLIPHSDELGALARALARTTRALADWFGLAHSAPTSDVHCRHPSTGAAAPAAASAANAPHEAGHGVTRKPRAAAPSPGLGAKTCTPRTSATLPNPTTRIASVRQSSREFGPLHRIRALRASQRRALNRALDPPKLHRQHFARSSYRCGIRLTGSCNSIFKDEHPSTAPIAPTLRPERAPHFTTLGSLRLPGPGSGSAFSSDSETWLQLPLMPAPATPVPRERHRIQMRERNTFVDGPCRVTAAGCHHATA
jgi:hypothetical protein